MSMRQRRTVLLVFFFPILRKDFPIYQKEKNVHWSGDLALYFRFYSTLKMYMAYIVHRSLPLPGNYSPATYR